jgi:hypothetical protein
MFFGEAPLDVKVMVVVATGGGSGSVGVFFSQEPLTPMAAARSIQVVRCTAEL